MEMNMIRIIKNTLVYLLLLLISINGYAKSNKEKYQVTTKVNKPSTFGETVINIGNLQNYVSNSTIYEYNGEDLKTFIIGDPTWENPSMYRSDDYYQGNYYLFYGTYMIGYNNSLIKFSTNTSNDFTTILYDPYKESPFEVSFSMSDDSAGSEKVGIKCICNIHAWDHEEYDDFHIYEYYIINQSGSYLSDVYAGFHQDCDISGAAGGSGSRGYFRDDLVSYFLGIDNQGNSESISYMWDADNPYIDGDDTGGSYTPKESLGFIGSRILESPRSTNGTLRNQQSGHQWWDWNSEPNNDSEWFDLLSMEQFKDIPGSPHDYRYFQTLGPWDMQDGDTVHLAFAYGIGNGLDTLRQNLQAAYDLYWNDFYIPYAPQIISSNPVSDSVFINAADSIVFEIEAIDKNFDNLIYDWRLNSVPIQISENRYIFKSLYPYFGNFNLELIVSDGELSTTKSWTIISSPPNEFKLHQNFPNPFNSSTKIIMEIPNYQKISVNIFDILGRKVKILANNYFFPGKYEFIWDGTSSKGKLVSSGLYFYAVQSEDKNGVKRLLFIK